MGPRFQLCKWRVVPCSWWDRPRGDMIRLWADRPIQPPGPHFLLGHLREWSWAPGLAQWFQDGGEEDVGEATFTGWRTSLWTHSGDYWWQSLPCTTLTRHSATSTPRLASFTQTWRKPGTVSWGRSKGQEPPDIYAVSELPWL